ncbi:MAG: ubiquinone biosynthesis accessory factor UbiJ [Gammaproteobacteria bacterium]
MSAPVLATLLAPAVARALNQALSGSQAAAADRKLLAHKLVAVELKELPLKLWFTAEKDKLAVHASHAGKADVTIRTTGLALFEAAWKRGETPPRGIELNGDAETAQIFSRLLKRADLDWEELLSHYLGDIPAHEIGKFARGAFRWGQDAGTRFGADLAEYLLYERKLLPARHEVDAFLDAVDRLRSDADRLAARLDRLAPRHRAP